MVKLVVRIRADAFACLLLAALAGCSGTSGADDTEHATTSGSDTAESTSEDAPEPCSAASEPAFTVTIDSDFDDGVNAVGARDKLPCAVQSVDTDTTRSEISFDCSVDSTPGRVAISIDLATPFAELVVGDAVLVSYSMSTDGPLVDAWSWFVVDDADAALRVAGGSGGTGFSFDPFSALGVAYRTDVCDEPANENGPCGPYVRSAVSLFFQGESALVLDRTAGTLGSSWTVRAGEIFMQVANPCDGSAHGSHAQWLLEPA